MKEREVIFDDDDDGDVHERWLGKQLVRQRTRTRRERERRCISLVCTRSLSPSRLLVGNATATRLAHSVSQLAETNIINRTENTMRAHRTRKDSRCHANEKECEHNKNVVRRGEQRTVERC